MFAFQTVVDLQILTFNPLVIDRDKEIQVTVESRNLKIPMVVLHSPTLIHHNSNKHHSSLLCQSSPILGLEVRQVWQV